MSTLVHGPGPPRDFVKSIPADEWIPTEIDEIDSEGRWFPTVYKHGERSTGSWLGVSTAGAWLVGSLHNGRSRTLNGPDRFIALCTLACRDRDEVFAEVQTTSRRLAVDGVSLWGTLPITEAVLGCLHFHKGSYIEPALRWVADGDWDAIETDLRMEVENLRLTTETRNHIAGLLLSEGRADLSLGSSTIVSTEALRELRDATSQFRAAVERADLDSSWSDLAIDETALADLDDLVERLEQGDLARLSDRAYRFSPTSSWSSLAAEGGWGDHYQVLAARVAGVVEELSNRTP